ncbi:pectin beta-glucuronyltransferase, family GT47 [Zostera marina]|uniref:Pectin beta-glucuronyltransferase, family GT47 n=1 Tax=Zostera marina TaxID=29655 RepID=A0A0K9PJM3_ZOSMR|nr:pectin beta-glucuronyltransferase, family GT47 [Zostera marina]
MKLFRRKITAKVFFRRPVLFVFLLYFLFLFTSSLFSFINLKLPTTTSSAVFSSTTAFSRVVLEQTTAATTNTFSLKVYVYNLPSKYNTDWLSNPRCSNHLFASEVAIHNAILNSSVHTTDPSEADFFFVPVYVSCNFSTVNGFPSISHARPLIRSAINLISTQFPFWNRSDGSDHVFVASHDFGSCFHAMEDIAISDGIPDFLNNSVLLQTFGMKGPHVCQDVEHVLIPPFVTPVDDVSLSSPENNRRDIFAFFRGKMEVHPKNISGRFYSKKVRTEILRRYETNPKFYIKRKRYDGFRSEIARSVFCLCPRGWAPWSPRLVESVILGCIPVIIADGIRLPFPIAVPWENISITIEENKVREIERVLDHVAVTNLSTIQKNLWDPNIRNALVYNRQIREGDATWQILRALMAKLDRSWRRRIDNQ